MTDTTADVPDVTPTSTAMTTMPTGSLDERVRYAQALASAGSLIPKGLQEMGVPSAGKVLLVIETGAMLNIHPVAALMGVHVIEGKATISPGLMSGVVRRAGHKLRVRVTRDDQGEPVATATLVRADDPDYPFESTWTMGRARAAKLTSKDNWKNYPEAMLKARAIGEVCREGAEDVLMGVKYTPEELGAATDDQGQMIDLGELSPQAAHRQQREREQQAAQAAEPTAEEYAGQVLEQMQAARSKPALKAVWGAAADGIRFTWAQQYTGMRAYAEDVTVTTVIDGADATVSLFDAFVAIAAGLPEDEPQTGDVHPAGGEEIVDAEVVEEPATTSRPTREGAERVTVNDAARAADDDPWATAAAGVPTADEAVASWDQAQQRGQEAAEDAGRPAPAVGSGRAAYEAEKVRTKQAAEQQAAEREAEKAARTQKRQDQDRAVKARQDGEPKE